jgi:hypothetical protein
VLDGRIPDGLTDIRGGWTLDDVTHAHDFLDELDHVEARARALAAQTGSQ